MPPADPHAPVPPPSPARVRIAGGLVAAAVVLAYSGSLNGPFVFDDVDAIPGNPTIRHLATALAPPAGGLTVSGRPILNLSFAVNYAVSGDRVWSYHAVNLLIHVAAALALFGIVRRTLERLGRRTPSVPIAFVAALLWAVHPLQTEAVTYIVQRAESLMGLFYLLTLYAFVRATGGDGGSRRAAGAWLAVSWLACLAGAGTKEVMATAPVVVLLYDGMFVAGSLREAWARRRLYYIGLGCAWVATGLLLATAPGRGGTAGFGAGLSWWSYGLAQIRAIAHYLRLSVWPEPLVFDYGTRLGGGAFSLAVDAAVVAGLAAVSIVLAVRRRPVGFLGVWILVILLPSSSVVPVATEIMAEHRMYLSLAGIAVGAACGIWALAEALGLGPRGSRAVCVGFGLAAAAALGFGTFRRNEVYANARLLWSDTVAKAPDNPRARDTLGIALAADGDLAGAEAQFRRALSLDPDLPRTWNNLANVQLKQGRLAEAIEAYRAALRGLPADPKIREDLGRALLREGRVDEAAEQFAESVRLDPRFAGGRFDLGNVLERQGRVAEAAAEYREAVRLDPGYADAWYDLANILAATGRTEESAEAYSRAVGLRPDFADARVNYGGVLARLGRTSEAIAEFQAALRLQPGAADIRDDLGSLLAAAGRTEEARAQYEEALRLAPGDPEARSGLDRIGAGP